MLRVLFESVRPDKLPAAEWFSEPKSERGRHGLHLRYLGTAGFVLHALGRTVVLDPYLSRHGVWKLLRAPLPSDQAAVARYVPAADDVFVGHAHYDHVLDAPDLCRRTGARLIGSRAVCMVGRAAGLPEAQLCETRGREDIASGAFTVRGLPSLHGKVLFGRVPFPGDIESPPTWPPRAAELRHGLVLNWLVRVAGFSLLHVDSADFLHSELREQRADLVCLCAAGWRARPNYVAEVAQTLRPRFIMPCHWDTMITAPDEPARLLPGVDLPGMINEIRRAGVEPLLLPMHGEWTF